MNADIKLHMKQVHTTQSSSGAAVEEKAGEKSLLGRP